MNTSELLAVLAKLEATINVDALVPELVKLLQEVAASGADGKFSLGEDLRLASQFLRMVEAARKAS